MYMGRRKIFFGPCQECKDVVILLKQSFLYINTLNKGCLFVYFRFLNLYSASSKSSSQWLCQGFCGSFKLEVSMWIVLSPSYMPTPQWKTMSQRFHTTPPLQLRIASIVYFKTPIFILFQLSKQRSSSIKCYCLLNRI